MIYFFVVYAPEVSLLSGEFVVPIVGVAILFYGVLLFKVWPNIEKDREKVNAILLPTTSLLAILVFYQTGVIEKMRVLDIVLYHFIAWTVLPLIGWRNKGGRNFVIRYLLLTGLLFSGFAYVVFPLTPWKDELWQTFFVAFYAYGYVHIFSSIGLSKSNPVYITRFFGLSSQENKVKSTT